MSRAGEALRGERSTILLAAILLSLALSSIILSSLLLRSGVANAGDLTWPYFNEPGLTGLYLDNAQTGIIPNQMIIYSWLFYLPVSTAIQERLLFFGTFLLMGVMCYYATFRVIQHEGAEKRIAHILAGAATVAYVFCPLNFYYVVDIFLLIGYALLPALLYTLLRFMWSERTLKDVLLFGGITGTIIALSSGDPRWAIWGVFIVTMMLFLMLAMGRFKGLLSGIGYLSVTVVIFTALSAFWILPTLFAPDQATLLARPNLSVNFYYVLNKYASLANSLVFQADFWTPTRELFFIKNGLLLSVYKAAQMVLPVLALASVLFFRKNRVVIPLLIISIIVLLLASAPLSPFDFVKDGYQYLVFEVPFGIAFRTSYKWLLLLAYPMVMMATYGVLGSSRWLSSVNLPRLRRGPELQAMVKHAAPALAIVLAISSIVATWPMASGDFSGVISPKDMSRDYVQAYDIIEEQAEGDYGFKILYLPINPYSGFPAPGLADSPYLHYLLTLLGRGDLSELGSSLAPLGARYIILDKTGYDNDTLQNELRKQTDLSVSYDGDQLLVLENRQYSDLFHFSDLAMNFDGIDSGALRAAWDNWIQTDQALLDLEVAFNSTPYVIMGPGYPYNLMVSESATSSPFLYMPYYGDQSWYFLTTYNPSNYEWISQLRTIGLEDWSLDFGEGVVYVAENQTIPIDLPLPDDALISHFDLSDPRVVEQFVESNYPEQFGARQLLEWDGSGMRVKLMSSTPGWKTVRSPLIEVNTNQTYTLMTDIRSQSGFDIHFKIAEYGANGTLLSVKPYFGLGSGDIDRTTVRMNYEAKDPQVKFISLQIWHGSDTTTPLPNTFWVDYLSVFNTTGLRKSPQLDGQIAVDEGGRYRLYVRTLNSPLGGNMSVAVDGEDATISTRSESTSMSWTYGGTLNLTAGRHEATILNGNGVNAVNLIFLIKEEDYAALLSHYNSQLADKALIYVLNGNISGDAHYLNADPSLGPTDHYLIVNKEVEIFRPSDYRVSVISDNDSSLYVDGELIGTLDADSGPLTLYLDAGRHNITVLSTEQYYTGKEALMFSANAGSDVTELESFYRSDGQVTGMVREGTSSYKLNTTTQGLSFLMFTHAFDSGWALSFSNGSELHGYSVPVNTAENGFIVLIDGNASLLLTYSPDRPYDIGVTVSLASAALIAVAVFLLYFWRFRLKGLSFHPWSRNAK